MGDLELVLRRYGRQLDTRCPPIGVAEIEEKQPHLGKIKGVFRIESKCLRHPADGVIESVRNSPVMESNEGVGFGIIGIDLERLLEPD